MDTIYKLLVYLRDRLREPSTYPAIMFIATGIAHWATLDEASRGQIVMSIGMVIAGLIGFLLPDQFKKSDPDATLPPKGDPK